MNKILKVRQDNVVNLSILGLHNAQIITRIQDGEQNLAQEMKLK